MIALGTSTNPIMTLLGQDDDDSSDDERERCWYTTHRKTMLDFRLPRNTDQSDGRGAKNHGQGCGRVCMFDPDRFTQEEVVIRSSLASLLG